MRYDFIDLKLFRAIAKTASLSAGAAQINLSAGSASYRLKNLERTIGTSLFLRSSRGMELTSAGDHLLQHVTRVFADLECLHAEMAEFAKGMRGSVRLVANSSSLNGFLPADLIGFLRANPAVNIELEEQNSEDIVLAINDGLADVGVMASDFQAPGLDVLSYAEDRLVLVVPHEHPLAARDSVTLDEALDHDFVCMHRTSSNYQFIAGKASRLGKHIKARIHVQNFATVLHLVAAGIGAAIVPRSMLGTVRAEEQCSVVALRDIWAVRSLKVVVRDLGQSSSFIKKLVSHLTTRKQAAGC